MLHQALGIGLPDRLERRLADLAAGGLAHQRERVLEAALDRGDEELLLRTVETEEVGLRDADPPCDVVGRGAVEAPGCKLDRGGLEDLLPAYLGGLADCGLGRHES